MCFVAVKSVEERASAMIFKARIYMTVDKLLYAQHC